MKTALKIFGIAFLVVLVSGAFYFYLGLPDVSDLKAKNPRSTALMVQRYREAKKTDKTWEVGKTEPQTAPECPRCGSNRATRAGGLDMNPARRQPKETNIAKATTRPRAMSHT